MSHPPEFLYASRIIEQHHVIPSFRASDWSVQGMLTPDWPGASTLVNTATSLTPVGLSWVWMKVTCSPGALYTDNPDTSGHWWPGWGGISDNQWTCMASSSNLGELLIISILSPCQQSVSEILCYMYVLVRVGCLVSFSHRGARAGGGLWAIETCHSLSSRVSLDTRAIIPCMVKSECRS